MIVFGVNSVLEALAASGAHVESVSIAGKRGNPRVQEIIDRARQLGIPVHFEPPEALTRKAGTRGHQSVIAELTEVSLIDLDEILASRPNRILLLDGVEDPRNLGAVLRTAEAIGVESVLLPQRRSCGVTATVVRTSAGAALHLRIGRIGNVVQALERLKDAGYWRIGLDMRGDEDSSAIDRSSPLVIVVGGEDRGLRRLVREHCDFLVRLPMRGQVSSLNLSVAAGVLLYTLFGDS
jgi:23S rRNA (guanosine2251-2'-O)-methyltransferase